ncbi:hypothetical protein ACFFRR_003151 [Megaselia abdita]
MAFYSASVDDEGQETKRTYSAGRNSNPSSRRQTPRTFLKTVKYVSSAAYIEKAVDGEDECEGQISNTTSSEVVPNLDLTSNESYPSTDNDMWYGKACEISKMITKPDAFQAWLSAKKKSQFYELMRKKAMEEEQEKSKAEKKKISEEKYQEWLKRKSSTTVPSKKKSPKGSSSPPTQIKSQEEIDRNFENWLLKKANYDKNLKEQLREQLEQKKILEETKKKISDKIYEKWLENAPYKPKPVPMNKGMLSLKGSTTEIFKNPEPWKKVLGDEVIDDLSTCEEVPEMRF